MCMVRSCAIYLKSLLLIAAVSVFLPLGNPPRPHTHVHWSLGSERFAVRALNGR